MDEQQAYEATIQMPEGASTLAPMVDSLYYEIFWISVAFFVGIMACMVWFGWRFRARAGVKSKPPGHHNALELFWTFAPLILLAYMFHQGFEGFMHMSVPPESSINVRVRARSWSWEFEQPNGMRSTNELRVPVHEPVRLIMSSLPTGSTPAVLHSFFVPAFRVKRDLVPGMYTSLWFEATREGEFQIYCTEYCGTGHSAMLGKVVVMSREDYDCYLQRGPSRPEQFSDDVAWGESMFSQCRACHQVEEGASRGVGPNLHNVAGYMQPLDDGTEVMADVEYLRRSILEPAADIVQGYGNQMPQFAFADSELDALVAYIASLSDRGDSLELGGDEGEDGAEGDGPCN